MSLQLRIVSKYIGDLGVALEESPRPYIGRTIDTNFDSRKTFCALLQSKREPQRRCCGYIRLDDLDPKGFFPGPGGQQVCKRWHWHRLSQKQLDLLARTWPHGGCDCQDFKRNIDQIKTDLKEADVEAMTKLLWGQEPGSAQIDQSARPVLVFALLCTYLAFSRHSKYCKIPSNYLEYKNLILNAINLVKLNERETVEIQ